MEWLIILNSSANLNKFHYWIYPASPIPLWNSVVYPLLNYNDFQPDKIRPISYHTERKCEDIRRNGERIITDLRQQGIPRGLPILRAFGSQQVNWARVRMEGPHWKYSNNQNLVEVSSERPPHHSRWFYNPLEVVARTVVSERPLEIRVEPPPPSRSPGCTWTAGAKSRIERILCRWDRIFL